ncbi:MAG: DUF6688 family protein [Myxococcota bacterium]
MQPPDDEAPARTRLGRFTSAIAAVALPLVAFGAGEAGVAEELLPEWDDGTAWVWGKLLYAVEVQRWTYPLLLWAMAAYVAAETGRRARWISVGLRGGVALAALYGALFLPVVPLAVAVAIYGVGLLGLSPYAALFAYGLAVGRYDRRQPPEPVPWAPWALWGALGLGGGAGAVHTLIELHAALPTEPPDCWLATVAARGDPRIVGSRPVRFADGRVRPVTRQLRVLKAFELALRARGPRLHAPVRAAYDRFGPRLAARLGPAGATATWFALSPVAAIAELALRAWLRGAGRMIATTYPPVAADDSASTSAAR